MTVKFLGQKTEVGESPEVLGGYAIVLQIACFCLLVYILQSLRKKKGTTEQNIFLWTCVGSLVGIILMALDTIIVSFRPNGDARWQSMLSFLGYGFIGVFPTYFSILYAAKKPSSKSYEVIVIASGVVYLLGGLALFGLYTFMEDSPTVVIILAMIWELLLAAILLLYLAKVTMSGSDKVQTIYYVCGVALVLGLTFYSCVYFIRDIWARGSEFVAEVILLGGIFGLARTQLLKIPGEEEESLVETRGDFLRV